MTKRTTLLAVTTCGAALALAGCGQSSSPAETSSTTSASPTTTTSSSTANGTAAAPTPDGKTYKGDGLEITKTWVKAIPDLSKSKMTGIFGTIKNTSDKEIVIVSGTQDQSARTELHETAMVNGSMQMRPIDGGFKIPAGGSYELKPGGSHIMIMAMTKPLPAGSTAKVTLTTKDGKTLAFDAIAWAFPGGGNEPYASTTGATSGGMSGGMSATMSSSSK